MQRTKYNKLKLNLRLTEYFNVIIKRFNINMLRQTPRWLKWYTHPKIR